MIKIEKAENGYIVKSSRIDEPDDVVVIEGEPEIAFKKLCHHLAGEMGFTYNKFGSFNFQCSFDLKGHKVE